MGQKYAVTQYKSIMLYRLGLNLINSFQYYKNKLMAMHATVLPTVTNPFYQQNNPTDGIFFHVMIRVFINSVYSKKVF